LPVGPEYHFHDMPDRIRARALVTALLVVLTVAAIGSLGPPGGFARHAASAFPVAFALELTLAGLLTALRWRHTPATPVAARLNQILRAALITGLIAIPVTYFVNRANLRATGGHGRFPRPSVLPTPTPTHPPATQPYGPPSALLRYLLIALLLIAIATAAVILWRRYRAKLTFGVPQDLAADEDPNSDLARAVESGRAALGELDDARAAIIACYVAMEASLAQAGTERGLTETPDELLVRAVAAGHVPPDPAARLTGLFYEARFSTHHLPAAKRDQAEQALAELAAELPIGHPS